MAFKPILLPANIDVLFVFDWLGDKAAIFANEVRPKPLWPTVLYGQPIKQKPVLLAIKCARSHQWLQSIERLLLQVQVSGMLDDEPHT